jgi:hypothetical protein
MKVRGGYANLRRSAAARRFILSRFCRVIRSAPWDWETTETTFHWVRKLGTALPVQGQRAYNVGEGYIGCNRLHFRRLQCNIDVQSAYTRNAVSSFRTWFALG